MKLCQIEGCLRPHEAKGLCKIHYIRVRRHGVAGTTALLRLRRTDELCIIEGCARPNHSRGLCSSHEKRLKKYGNPLSGPPIRPYLLDRSDLERFWARTGFWDGHYIWLGGRNAGGYGWFSIDAAPVISHRWIYEQEVGPIPEGLVIDHLCRIPACQNTDHMEPVSIAENVRRSPLTQLKQSHCKRDHPLEDPNLYYASDGTRRCKRCVLMRSRGEVST